MNKIKTLSKRSSEKTPIKKSRKQSFLTVVSALVFLVTIITLTSNLIINEVSATKNRPITDFANASSLQNLLALTPTQAGEFSQNNIMFYDPTECRSSGNKNISGACGGDVTGTDPWDRLRQTVEKYGVAAMNLQIEYGIPWEIPFVHMWAESKMGSNPDDIAAGVAACGHFDWMGYRYSESSLYGLTLEEMGTCIVTHRNGGPASQYETIADMMGALATDYLRNGAYDAAFVFATQENFNLEKFLRKETDGVYCAAGCGDYYVSILNTILPTVREVASSHNWPTSEELMKQKNIQKGGNWPVNGDVKAAMNVPPHSLHLDCDGNSNGSTVSNPSANITGSASVSGDQITWIGDSYSVHANALISEKYPGVDFGPGSVGSETSYIRSCKEVSNDETACNAPNTSCLTILKNLINAGDLRPYLVMACGTNGGWSDSDISEFKGLIEGTNTKAVVVNSKIPKAAYTESNNRLKNLASSTENVSLADWTTVYNESYFADDPEGLHPTAGEGYEKWLGVIEGALSGVSSGGCTTFSGDYPEYNQASEPWGSQSYGGGTINSSGCGAASMAMLATVAAGQDIFPNDIADLLGEGRTYNNTIGSGMASYDKIVGDHYGFSVEAVSVSEGDKNDVYKKMKEYLTDGYMLHFSGAGSLPFSGGGHYVGIFAINGDDTVMVADSAHGNKEYKLMDVINAGYHGDAFSAIAGGTALGGKCSNLCRTSSSAGTVEGGLTEDEAKKLAEYYNSDKVDASTLVLGRKDNCVSLSAWFVNTFAGVSLPSYGNGRDVVSNLGSQAGLETGSDPRPYAIFSYPNGTTTCAGGVPCGHTGVVVGVNGDDIITVEAYYENSINATIVHRNRTYFEASPTPFAYTDNKLNATKLKEIVKGN